MAARIHQEVVFKGSPKRLYDVLTDARQFSEVTGGAPTEISREVGGSFSCFGGMVVGRQVELVPNQRIVQAWRAKDWDAGVYSIAKFELTGQGSETRLIFDHSGFPEDQQEHLAGGWHAHYWEPMRKYLA